MRVERRPVPEPGPGEVLLKVDVASICMTDVKVLHRTLMGQPAGEFVMGHEYAGTVAALGPDVDEVTVGDRVAVEVHKGCERCDPTRNMARFDGLSVTPTLFPGEWVLGV